jgi:DNA-binding LacI/PurR family transcriptional regulator
MPVHSLNRISLISGKTLMTDKPQQQQKGGQRAGVIGVVSEGFSNPWTLKMLDELTRQLDLRGYLPLLLNARSADRTLSLMQKASGLEPGGLVFLTADGDAQTVAGDLLPGVPVIQLGGASEGEESVVAAEGYQAGVESGKLLLSQGYQRFGFMQGKDRASTPLRQMAGFADSLTAADKRLDRVLIAGNDDRELAWQAMTAYLKQTRASERINALLCENDLLAFGAIQAIRDFGQGVHIGVVGFNDSDDAGSSTWHLTSWAPRGDLLVTEALNRLLDKRADLSGQWQQGELQVRHSHLGKEVLGDIPKCGCASRH